MAILLPSFLGLLALVTSVTYASITSVAPVAAWPPANATTILYTGLGPFNILMTIDHTLVSSSASSSVPTVVPPGNCNSAPLAINANTVTLNLFGDQDCCTSFQTIKMGALDECHNSTQPLSSFVQAVDSAMFNRGIQILLYSGENCQGSVQNIGLTNAAQCWADQSGRWQSLAITTNIPVGIGEGSSSSSSATPTHTATTKPVSSSTSTSTSAVATCSASSPAINANVVTLNLFGDEGCCTTAAQTIKMGTLDECHNSTQPLRSFAQAVDSTMFNRGVQILMYSGQNCRGNMQNFGLTNAAQCWADQTGSWQSFVITANPPVGISSAGSTPSSTASRKSSTTSIATKAASSTPPTTPSCPSQQPSCDANTCAGTFNLNTGVAFCTGSLAGCQCQPTTNTCGAAQSCDKNNCDVRDICADSDHLVHVQGTF